MLLGLAIHAIAMTIAVKEGFFRPGSLPRRLHNPGALVYAGQPGAIQGDIGRDAGHRPYARFTTDAAGWAALERDIAKKMREGRPLKPAWKYLK